MNKDNKFFDKKQIENKELISKALSEYAIFNCYEFLLKKELNLIAKNVDWELVSDSEIAGKKELIQRLNWVEFVDRMQILRLAIRDLENIDLYPLGDFEYEADEIMKAAKIEPTILDRVQIKQDSLKPRHIIEISRIHPEHKHRIDLEKEEMTEKECIDLAKMGDETVLDLYDFSSLKDSEKMRIIKAHNFSENVLNKMNAFDESFDNKFYVREILANTGMKYFERLHTQNLTPNDWLFLVRSVDCFPSDDNEFLNFIPIEEFFECDVYFFVELCILYPRFLDYMTQDIADEISSLGWQKLFTRFNKTEFDEQLIQLCDFDSLEERAWVVFENKRPDLLLYRV